jgi:hypothetical protein
VCHHAKAFGSGNLSNRSYAEWGREWDLGFRAVTYRPNPLVRSLLKTVRAAAMSIRSLPKSAGRAGKCGPVRDITSAALCG